MTIDLENEQLQAEDPIALVRGEAYTALPKDLYIPPEALQVILESFEGPLDLLLYLIKRQNLDILDIPVAEITRQYVSYVELMHIMNFELAAEYLVMAAMLAEIKSRMLLPRSAEDAADNETDPRAELVRRLQEYERFKRAAENIDNLERMDRDFFPISAVDSGEISAPMALGQVDLKELLAALVKVFERAKLNAHHHIEKEVLSLRERMSDILHKIRSDEFTRFSDLFDCSEGRLGVVVSFIAVLELLKQSMIEIVQAEPFAPIHVKAVA
ncbi:MAG: segregation/condensation protein A [Gammaproteobacteria bacterium]|nr:segregation/condensation protein A [Gammaproteobacteria bacterium]